MELYRIKVDNYLKTQEIAYKLSNYLNSGSVITLEGELGVGKTVFTQGLAKGLEIKEIVNSPTFSIIKEYLGKLPLYHMDVYRLDKGLEDLGFEEYFYGEGITVVEWPSLIKEFLPEEYLNIRFQKEEGNNRSIYFEPHGNQYKYMCKEFFYNEDIVD